MESDYVKMLEVPISSSSVTFKPMKKKRNAKKQVIEKVNAQANQEVVETPQPKKKKKIKENPPREVQTVEIKNTGFDIVSVQVVAIFVLIVAIILTNVFWENSGINTLLRSVFNKESEISSAVYTSFSASAPSRTDDVTCSNGVITVASGSVYSPCNGVIESITQNAGKYTVTVRHSDSFTTVIEGLESVYQGVNETVYNSVPLGYSSESSQVTMYSNGAVVTGFVITEGLIVWLG